MNEKKFLNEIQTIDFDKIINKSQNIYIYIYIYIHCMMMRFFHKI